MPDSTLETLRANNPPTTITGTELIYGVQGGNSTAFTINEIAAALVGIVEAQTYDAPWRGATVELTSDATGLTFPVTVSWDGTRRDTDGFWSPGSPTRLTPPAGVTKVRLSASVALESGSTYDGFSINIRKNGSTQDGTGFDNIRYNGSVDNFSNNVATLSSDVVDVTEGDYFELRLNTADTRYSEIQAVAWTWFTIEVVEVVSP